MNYEFVENIIKAKQYTDAAVRSLVPEDVKKHLNVIHNEMTDMTIEILQRHKKEQNHNEDSSQTNKETKEKVRKVEIF